MTYALFNRNTFNFRRGRFNSRQKARVAKRSMTRPSNWRIALVNDKGAVVGWTR